MAKPDQYQTESDRKDARALIKNIRQETNLLINLVLEQNPEYIAFDVEQIQRLDEEKVKAEGIQSLNVTQISGRENVTDVIKTWGRFHKEFHISPIFNFRMPAVVAIKSKHEEIMTLILHINNLKEQIHALVKRGREPFARNEFIHSVDQSIITEQLYRKIPFVTEEVTRVWFNWTQRPTPKVFSIEQFHHYLDRIVNRVPVQFTETEWASRLRILETHASDGRYKQIQKFKLRNAVIVVDMKTTSDDPKRMTVQKQATTPIILFSNAEKMPSYTLLKSYSKEEHEAKLKRKPLVANKEWIDKSLKIIGVLHDHTKH